MILLISLSEIMDISTKGLIEVMSHEGLCLSPYLDSVGVWTIGLGITKYDGKDPRDFGTITIDQAITMFKDRIKAYVDPVKKLPLSLSQSQFDALVSFTYNCGAGNLAKLVKGRTISQIGDALMLYTIPKEITARRQAEQNLYKAGKYVANGKVLVFPVSASHKPVYSKGYVIDVSKYFADAPVPEQTIVKKVVTPPVPVTPSSEPEIDNPVWKWLKEH